MKTRNESKNLRALEIVHDKDTNKTQKEGYNDVGLRLLKCLRSRFVVLGDPLFNLYRENINKNVGTGYC